MREAPITQQRLNINARVNETGGPMGPANLTKNVANDLRQRRDNYQQQSFQNAYLKGQSVIAADISELESRHATDPAALSQAIDDYTGAFLDEVNDFELQSRFEQQIGLTGQASISRATSKRNQIIDSEATFQTFQSLDMLQTEVENTAVNLFDPDPQVALSASRQLQEQMSRGQQIIEQRGTDGTHLISPEKGFNSLMALRDGSYRSAVTAWMGTQPNKLDAAEQWLNGQVEVTLPGEDEESIAVNLRETMPATSIAKIDNEVMGMMRDHIAITNMRITMEDKVFEEQAEQTYIDHLSRMQGAATGSDVQPLTIDELDQQRQVYLKGGREKEYTTLRKSLIEGAPIVVDGTIKSQLLSMAYSGINPVEFGRASVANGRVDWQTVSEAKSVYDSMTGPSSDVQNFYTSQLVRAMGGQNQSLDIAAQETISRAVIEMQTQYKQLQQAGVLDDNKAKEIFERVLENNSNLSLEDRVIARTPQFIPKSLVGQRASVESSQEFANRINDHFMRKYNGDIDKALDDPDYLSAKSWLNDYKSQIRSNSLNRVE